MFKKKSGPELFELIKKGKLLAKKAPPPEEPVPSEPGPQQPRPAIPQSKITGQRPYPKWKIPFPKLNAAGATSGEKSFNIKRNAVVLLVILGLLFLVVAFVIGYKAGTKKEEQTVVVLPPTQPTASLTPTTLPLSTLPPRVTTPTTIPPIRPPVSQRTWSIRLIFYDDDTAGQASAKNMLRWLRQRGIANTFIKRESIRSRMRLSICVGTFGSQLEASRSLDRYRKLHTAFRHCDVVEKK